MKRPIVVRFNKVFFYLPGLFLFYLAGAYFGGFFRTMFFVYTLLPAVSFFQLLLTWVSVKYHQDFSTNHPLKGQEVRYTVTLSKESPVPSSHIIIRFKSTQQEMGAGFADIHEIPGRTRSFVSEKVIKCPFRGVYTVGLEDLIIEDIMRWFSISMDVWYRTFYVYPRIIELNSVQLGIQGQMTNLSGSVEGTVQDYTLFEALKSYRSGESTRHVAWKKFAALGEPFIRTFDTTAQPGVTIYLDTRRAGGADYTTMSAEDCSVEILVAIVKVLMKRDIPVAVHASGWERYHFSGNDEALFTRFHHNTVSIYFKPGPSPVELFRADLADNRLSTQSVLFISHLLDPEILSLFGTGSSRDLSTAAVFNLSGFTKNDKEKARHLIQTVNRSEGKVFIVNDTDSIKEDLE